MKKILLFFTSILILGFSPLYAADTDVSCFNPQLTNNYGSNNSIISFLPSLNNIFNGYYVNRDNDSSIIGNYLRGYYYDNVFGFFKLDWSNNQNQNVHFVASTNKCSTGYGYKFAGYARGAETSQSLSGGYVGFINFAYNNDIFVYYCENDNKLHGYAYSKDLGFQNFEGISLEIITNSEEVILQRSANSFFVNDYTNILEDNINIPNSIQGDVPSMKQGKESIFYIIK